MQAKRPNHELSEGRCPLHLDDVDLFAPGAQEYWYEAYDILHAEAPVHRIPGEGYLPGSDAFILSRHEDIARVVRDEQRFPVVVTDLAVPTDMSVEQVMEATNEGKDPFELPNITTVVASMATLRPTPELWRAHRQELTDPWVGLGAGRHREMVERVANGLVDKWIDRGTIEFVSEFAQPLPHTVIANVLGWPLADLKLLKKFGDGTAMPFVQGRKHNNLLNEEEIKSQFAVLKEFEEYTNDLIREKRRNPAEDMISFLTQVDYSPLERKLTDLEINGIIYGMVFGGLETTQYALAEQVQLLIERDGVWEELKADRSKIRAFTEEGMRLRAPSQGISTRITSQEEVFQGVEVPKGSYLHLRWGAANVDPTEWDEVHELKLDRRAGARHLTFSQGRRVCPGAQLSRLEQTVAWNTLLDRVGRFEYAEDNDFLHQSGILLQTLRLNLTFTKA